MATEPNKSPAYVFSSSECTLPFLEVTNKEAYGQRDDDRVLVQCASAGDCSGTLSPSDTRAAPSCFFVASEKPHLPLVFTLKKQPSAAFGWSESNDELGRSEKYTYDALGRLLTVTADRKASENTP